MPSRRGASSRSFLDEASAEGRAETRTETRSEKEAASRGDCFLAGLASREEVARLAAGFLEELASRGNRAEKP